VIRIVTKIELIGPWAMPYPSKKFRQNLFRRSQLFQLSDGQTDKQTNEQTRGRIRAGLSFQLAGYTINTHKMVARYAPHILISPAPHTTAAPLLRSSSRLFIARTTTRYDLPRAKVTVAYPAQSWEQTNRSENITFGGGKNLKTFSFCQLIF